MDIGLNWESLNRPVEWQNLFGNSNPVDCEIGYGNGEFLVHKAIEYPKRNFFGIDYGAKLYRKAREEVGEAGLTNVRVICMEARATFLILVPECSLSHVYVNFPDPWPKKKHGKNRLLDKEFFALTATRVMDGGEIIIITDDSFYRDFILFEMEATQLWKSLFYKGYTDELSGYYRTRYEKKWRENGKSIYYMIFQKKGNPEKEYKLKEYAISDMVFPNFDPSFLEKVTGKTIKDGDSVARILKTGETDNGIKLELLLKDGTLVRKRTLHIERGEKKEWKLQLPDNLFCTHSFKIFTDRLKTLNK